METQVGRVARTPIVKAAWAQGRSLQIHGWIYGLKDGLVRDLGVTQSGTPSPSARTERRSFVDPTPIDDWSDHIRMSAIHVLEGRSRCKCGETGNTRCDGLAEAAE